MSTFITPTKGRIIYLRPYGSKDETLYPGMIAHVNTDGTINVAAADTWGSQYIALNVPLLQGEEERPQYEPYAEWMPYQVQQAARAEMDTATNDINKVYGRESMRLEAPTYVGQTAADYPAVTYDKFGVKDKLNREDIDEVIISVQYHVFPGTTMTVCCLTLTNGYNVTGESACVVKENYDQFKGEELAFKDAVQKIWMLEGYLLKQAKFMTAIKAIPDPFEDE